MATKKKTTKSKAKKPAKTTATKRKPQRKKATGSMKSRRRKPQVERWAELFHFQIPKKEKKGRGRKRVIDDTTVAKLELAFAYDCTVEEACVLAQIHRSTYYDFVKEHPEFSDNIELLRTIPFLVARQVVLEGIESDPNLALKYLERKLKKEFSLKLELGHSGSVATTHDLAPKAKEAVDNVFALFEKKAREVGNDQAVTYDDDDELLSDKDRE